MTVATMVVPVALSPKLHLITRTLKGVRAGHMPSLLPLTLLALAVAPLRAQAPQVFLNHVVVVVDSASYAAIGESVFLKDTLGFLDRRSTSSSGRSWTGTYLVGRSTYVEFFAPGGPAGAEGFSMIGYGVEEPGAIRVVRSRLAASTGHPVDSLLFNKEDPGGPVPWFHAVAVEGAMTASVIPTWVMEYDPRFFARPGAEGAGRSGIGRDRALADWYAPQKPLVNVVGIELAVDSTDRARIVAEASAFGYQARGDELRGPDLTIRFVSAKGARKGVVAVDLLLGRPSPSPGRRVLGPKVELDVVSATKAVLRVR